MSGPSNTVGASAIEAQFPRIAQSIMLMWGHPELDRFFAKLTVDDRGDRQGFPPEVMSELMFLARLHGIAYPFEAAKPRYANRGGYDLAFAYP